MKFNSTAAITFIALSFTVFCFGYGAVSYIQKGLPGGAIIFILCAILFFFAAVKIALTHSMTLATKEDDEKLKRNGKLVVTQFKAIDRRWSVQVNGQSPIIIYSQGIDPSTKQPKVFESKDLWLSGGDASQYQNPAFKAWQALQGADQTRTFLIPVYVDKMNAGRYFMDLANIEEKKTQNNI